MAMPWQLTDSNSAYSLTGGPAFYGMGAGYAPTQVENAGVVNNRANLGFQKDKLAADQANAGADRALQLQLGSMPWRFKDKVFGTISPLLQQLMGGQGPGGTVGGQNPAIPQVDASPIWNPQQINQQVNSAKANNAASAETQSVGVQGKLASQGFGSKSPLLAALQGNIGQAKMGADADAERGIRWDAASGNAGQVMKGQTANQNAAVAFNNADIERRKSNNQYTTSLMSILGGLA